MRIYVIIMIKEVSELNKQELRIKLKPFKKYRNVFYYLFHHSLFISLIPFIAGVVIIFSFSKIIGLILVLSVLIYDFVIFELIDNYLWKRNIPSRKLS